MARTKLERYIDILKTLAQNGSPKTSNVACETKINYNELKKYLDFLLTQGLVDHERVSNKRTAYSITHKGITILNYFKEQNKCSQWRTCKDRHRLNCTSDSEFFKMRSVEKQIRKRWIQV